MYLPDSCDGLTDRFQFEIKNVPVVYGGRLQLAIRFHCKGELYWDNNCGINYIFQAVAGNGSSAVYDTIEDNPWVTQLW